MNAALPPSCATPTTVLAAEPPEHSIAGYTGLSRKLINIKDCYDETELKGINPNLRFLQEVDKRTGYRTRNMLCMPVTTHHGNRVGVMQILNKRAGGFEMTHVSYRVNTQAIQDVITGDTQLMVDGIPVLIKDNIETQNMPTTAGSLALAGTLLGAFVSPWFYILPGFVGAGLLTAGVTGFCGMALLLMRAPWNRAAFASRSA